MVPKHTAIAEVDGVLNCVAVDGDFVGEVVLVGRGAGGPATASAVTSDLIDIARGNILPPFGITAKDLKPYKKAQMRAHEGGYYIRLSVYDWRICGDREPHGRARHFAREHRATPGSRRGAARGRPPAQGRAGRRGADHPSNHRGRHRRNSVAGASSATAMSMQSRR